MIAVRDGLNIEQSDDIRLFLPQTALNDSDKKEFVCRDRFEASLAEKSEGRALFDHVLFKADFIRTFNEIKSRLDIQPGHRVLELGASHGWASVIAKSDCPECYVVAADVVPDCVRHAAGYENLIGSKIDEKWAFSVRDIPFADATFDRIFTFAAFHHFGDHGDYTQSITEIARILKPGGKIVTLYEPCSPQMLYKRAYKRVNRNRAHDGVDEDVLVIDKLRRIGEPLGLTVTHEPYPIYAYRSSAQSTIYYYLISKLKLSHFLVCTANVTMTTKG